MTLHLMAVILLVAGLGLAALLLSMVRSGSGVPVSRVEDLEGKIETIDLIAFRNLIDPDEAQLLRKNLPARAYRKVQRLRTRAAIAYVCSVYHNAGLTIRLAQQLISSPDITIRREAENIQELSVQSRIFAIRSLVKLTGSFVFPQSPVSLQELATSYVNIAERMEMLCTLTAPLYTSRIAAAFR